MTSFRFLAFTTALGLSAGAASAVVVDFETLPGGGTPTAGQGITTQYSELGVTFELRDEAGAVVAGGPRIGQVGGVPGTDNRVEGFFGPPDDSGRDAIAPADAASIGQFFLTDNASLSNDARDSFTLVATFSAPALSVSLDILDVDNTESFLLQAFDAAAGGSLIDSTSTAGGAVGAGDGVATPVFVGGAGIRRIEITGTAASDPALALGFGYDNFDVNFGGAAVAIPLPAGLPLLAGGLLGLGVLRRRAGRAAR